MLRMFNELQESMAQVVRKTQVSIREAMRKLQSGMTEIRSMVGDTKNSIEVLSIIKIAAEERTEELQDEMMKQDEKTSR